MSELYDQLLALKSLELKVGAALEEPRVIKNCTVCEEPVTTDDSYIIEAVNSNKVMYIHYACKRRRNARVNKK